MPDRQQDLKRRAAASFAQSIRAVLWSFFGVRKGKDHERDLAGLNPLHLIVAGLACAAVFIGILLVIIHWVTQTAS
ncbi:DUF2970 domain-containing protein [Mycetohabitans sp. B8]|uniref:DUF2970 domain-containing protein n=1 Tax=Mycetohabitans sp. B8 TaxID=2841845 RepID=UPI001F2D62F9|nr:DUF2970 domain-containing protein [Mycetohabitans sp. B8]MCG1043455.1 DUF2970 domain-containing protein [Mycetohabitans sp. B8]